MPAQPALRAAVCVLALATLPPVLAGDTAADRAKAEAAVADLGQSLRGALVATMQASGPVGAVGFCHDEAPRITAAVAERHGVRLGRIGVRLRNPANRPEPWLEDVIGSFARAASSGVAPADLVAVVDADLPTGVDLRFARGIGTEAGCLVCHGEAVAEPVQAAIRARYPDDAAVGFRIGELRGAFWVEIPAGTAAAPVDRASDGPALAPAPR